MDNAVALVQTYLRVTDTSLSLKYPVVEAIRNGGNREATDLDIIGVPIWGASQEIPGAGQDALAYALDTGGR